MSKIKLTSKRLEELTKIYYNKDVIFLGILCDKSGN